MQYLRLDTRLREEPCKLHYGTSGCHLTILSHFPEMPKGGKPMYHLKLLMYEMRYHCKIHSVEQCTINI